MRKTKEPLMKLCILTIFGQYYNPVASMDF